jgi:hypothetical protein
VALLLIPGFLFTGYTLGGCVRQKQAIRKASFNGPDLSLIFTFQDLPMFKLTLGLSV